MGGMDAVEGPEGGRRFIPTPAEIRLPGRMRPAGGMAPSRGKKKARPIPAGLFSQSPVVRARNLVENQLRLDRRRKIARAASDPVSSAQVEGSGTTTSAKLPLSK